MYFYGIMADDPPPTLVVETKEERCPTCSGTGIICTHPNLETVKYVKCKECNEGKVQRPVTV